MSKTHINIEHKLLPVEPTVKELYGEFSQWCSENQGMDFDCRLHTHGGRIEEGGYISHEKTRHAFAAYRAGRKMAMLAAAPAAQGELVAFCEDTALSIAERTFSTEVDEQLASNIIQYAQLLHSLYTAQQPEECTLNSDREQVTKVEAPSNSLPSWSECNLRVGNSKWLKDNDREVECDSLTANPLHEFIYEYDDSDAYKSAWFLHRLENLISFIKSEQ